MTLFYDSRAIWKIEKESGMPLTDMIQIPSMNHVVIFIKTGRHCTEDQAFSEIDQYRKDGKGTFLDIFAEVLKALQEQGFLPGIEKEKETQVQPETVSPSTSTSVGEEVKD